MVKNGEWFLTINLTWTKGKAYTSVLPDPVGAETHKSEGGVKFRERSEISWHPANMSGIMWLCTAKFRGI